MAGSRAPSAGLRFPGKRVFGKIETRKTRNLSDHGSTFWGNIACLIGQELQNQGAYLIMEALFLKIIVCLIGQELQNQGTYLIMKALFWGI